MIMQKEIEELNYLERLMDVYNLINNHKYGVTKKDILDRYEVTERTFENYKKTLRESFGVNLKVDSSYRYTIEDGYERNIVDAFSSCIALRNVGELGGRIHLENTPSGERWLSVVVEAMKNNNMLKLQYCQHFGESEEKTVEPWGLVKEQNRWYIVQHISKTKIETFCLDRIEVLEILPETFKMNSRYEVSGDFEARFGVMSHGFEDESIDPKLICIKFFENQADYVHSLPMHISQEDMGNDEFRYFFRPTYDFYKALFSYVDAAEVTSPDIVRKTATDFAIKIFEKYTHAATTFLTELLCRPLGESATKNDLAFDYTTEQWGDASFFFAKDGREITFIHNVAETWLVDKTEEKQTKIELPFADIASGEAIKTVKKMVKSFLK